MARARLECNAEAEIRILRAQVPVKAVLVAPVKHIQADNSRKDVRLRPINVRGAVERIREGAIETAARLKDAIPDSSTSTGRVRRHLRFRRETAELRGREAGENRVMRHLIRNTG